MKYSFPFANIKLCEVKETNVLQPAPWLPNISSSTANCSLNHWSKKRKQEHCSPSFVVAYFCRGNQFRRFPRRLCLLTRSPPRKWYIWPRRNVCSAEKVEKRGKYLKIQSANMRSDRPETSQGKEPLEKTASERGGGEKLNSKGHLQIKGRERPWGMLERGLLSSVKRERGTLRAEVIVVLTPSLLSRAFKDGSLAHGKKWAKSRPAGISSVVSPALLYLYSTLGYRRKVFTLQTSYLERNSIFLQRRSQESTRTCKPF